MSYHEEEYIRALRDQVAAAEALVNWCEAITRDQWAHVADERIDELLTALRTNDDLSQFCAPDLEPQEFLRALACVTVAREHLRRSEVELLQAQDG